MNGDVAWALREADDLEADAAHYEALIRRHGKQRLWIQAAQDDRDAASHLRRLAEQVRKVDRRLSEGAKRGK